jgi:trehalose 6-phosphate phosphatase
MSTLLPDQSRALAPDPRTLRAHRIGLFLDVDGTLLDFAPTPDGARVDDAMLVLLSRLRETLGGSVALISGRSLAQIDALFRPLALPAAGIHGFERRSASGVLYRPSTSELALDRVRRWLKSKVLPDSGLLLEDKGHSLALHFRLAPQSSGRAFASARSALAELGPGYEIIEGAQVVELKPAGLNKATAIEAFMKEPPFEGCVPVFLGDDVTDFDGFAAVRGHGGFDIAVGNRTSARWYLESPTAARAWLRELADCLAARRT